MLLCVRMSNDLIVINITAYILKVKNTGVFAHWSMWGAPYLGEGSTRLLIKSYQKKVCQAHFLYNPI